MAITSFLQTTEVILPNSTTKFLTIKQAPPRILFEPDELCTKVQYDVDLDMYVFWEHTGLIKVLHANGVIEIYHPKPTIADIMSRPSFGEYYRVHADGSVEHGYDGVYYYWGKEEEVEWNVNNITKAPASMCSCMHGTDSESEDDSDDEIILDNFKRLHLSASRIY